jgi:shikimate dehydrogenase
MQDKNVKTFLVLNPDEMAFRKIYWTLLLQNQITTVFRPGKRTSGMPRAYVEGQIVKARVIDSIGADWAGVPPQFVSELSKQIRITKIQAKRLGELKRADFNGSSPDVTNKLSLRYHLGSIYNLYMDDLKNDAWITIIKFEYVNMEEIKTENSKETYDLLNSRVLSFAKKPQDNPEALSFGRYAITLIGHDYAGKTPRLWNSAYKKLNLSYANAMLVGKVSDAAKIADALRKDSRYLGGGAGVGFKDVIVNYLDEIDPLAEKIGAVNFIQKTADGKLKGYNTDGMGYAASVQELFAQLGKSLKGKAIIIGAGGTGNAIAFMLAKLGMKIVIVNRSLEKAEKLAGRINEYFQLKEGFAVRTQAEEKLRSEVKDADLIVNVSTKGATGDFENHHALAPAQKHEEETMHQQLLKKNHETAEEIFSLIPKTAIISDIVLRETDTPFLKRAKELGFQTLDGIPMVIGQAVEAFWLLHESELKELRISKVQLKEAMQQALS